MRKFKIAREELQRDPAEINGLKPTCYKCGLTLANPGELSVQALEELKASILKMDQEITELDTQLMIKRRTLEDYESNLSLHSNQVENFKKMAEKAGRQLAGIVHKEARVEAEQRALNLSELKIQLPLMVKETQRVGTAIQEKLREKSRYQLAHANWEQREQYSSEVEIVWSSKYSDMETGVKAYRKQFDEMTRLSALMEASSKRMTDLTGEKLELGKYLDQPMPGHVAPLAAELKGNITAVKAELNARQEARIALHGRFIQAEETEKTVTWEYEILQARARADAEKRLLIEDLKLLAEVMHTDGLPMAVVNHHFKYLAQLTQGALNQLHANFIIEIDPDQSLGFRFTRLDEVNSEPLPMNKLSGGQRIRLCTAFLIAVQQRLVKEVGLLVLDEPSQHYDLAGVEALAEFISDLGRQLQNTEMQVWISDHHQELRRSMHKVLELS